MRISVKSALTEISGPRLISFSQSKLDVDSVALPGSTRYQVELEPVPGQFHLKAGPIEFLNRERPSSNKMHIAAYHV